jgi:predicted amidophosphoribosyltransferase
VTLTVDEAAGTYERAMRNVLPAGVGVCPICHTFIDPTYSTCYRCGFDPQYLDAVVPITYSEHLSQMHTALRNYKDGPVEAQVYAMPRLASILWKFLEQHEVCVAANAGLSTETFDVVTTVPSSMRDRDERRSNLRWLVEVGCEPTAVRFERILRPSDAAAAGRSVDPERYVAERPLQGASVLLIDDTWTTGGHAQSAGGALKVAGADRVGCVTIGRHVNPKYEVGDMTCGDRLAELPRIFDWDVCCVHPNG